MTLFAGESEIRDRDGCASAECTYGPTSVNTLGSCNAACGRYRRRLENG